MSLKMKKIIVTVENPQYYFESQKLFLSLRYRIEFVDRPMIEITKVFAADMFESTFDLTMDSIKREIKTYCINNEKDLLKQEKE